MEQWAEYASNFNVAWYGQVLETFVSSFPNSHRCYGLISYESVPNIIHTSYCKQKIRPKSALQRYPERLVASTPTKVLSL